jgi:hypothetical protein
MAPVEQMIYYRLAAVKMLEVLFELAWGEFEEGQRKRLRDYAPGTVRRVCATSAEAW